MEKADSPSSHPFLSWVYENSPVWSPAINAAMGADPAHSGIRAPPKQMTTPCKLNCIDSRQPAGGVVGDKPGLLGAVKKMNYFSNR